MHSSHVVSFVVISFVYWCYYRMEDVGHLKEAIASNRIIRCELRSVACSGAVASELQCGDTVGGFTGLDVVVWL